MNDTPRTPTPALLTIVEDFNRHLDQFGYEFSSLVIQEYETGIEWFLDTIQAKEQHKCSFTLVDPF